MSASVGAPTAAPPSESSPWVEHDLRITNDGDAPVFLNDIRQAAFLGEPRTLLAGDNIGCGYGFSGNEPVSPACQADYRPFSIPAHQTHVVRIILWKDLAGLAPLRPGRYVLEKPVHYRQDRPFDDPRDFGKTGAIVLTYDVGDEAAAPAESVPVPPVKPPTLAPDPGAPPPVTLRFDERSESVKAFSFCWTGEPGPDGSRQAVCADGIPPKDPVLVDGASEVVIDFPLSGFAFTATFMTAGNPCGRYQTEPVERREDGRFVLRPAGRSGSYDVHLAAKGSDSASYLFRWNTPSDGVLPRPEASLAVISRNAPDFSYGIEMAVSHLNRTPDDVKAMITVTAANGRSLTFEPTRAANPCQPEGSLSWDGPDDRGKAAGRLGSEPYTYEVVLILDGARHVARASYPADQIVGNEPSVALKFDPPLPGLA